MSAYFAKRPPGYMGKRSAKFARFVMDRISHPELGSYKTCIELGAGIGRFTPPLIERFDQVHLVEPVSSYAKLLEDRFASDRVTVSALSAEQFLGDWTEDAPVVLFAFHLLHHLTYAQRQHIYAFLKRTHSRGVFVEPNPWNPLILLQVLLTPGMNFTGERQYLRLTRARLTAELSEAGLDIANFRRIVALPPGITDTFLHCGLGSVLRLCEGLTAAPCAASYHAFHAVSGDGL